MPTPEDIMRHYDSDPDEDPWVRGKPAPPATADRFEAVRGKADLVWRTDDLMRLLRGEN